MSAIDVQYEQLKAKGFDLGAALTAETDAAAGGRVRTYQNGNIYWDSATGAHEVHGGILALYLAYGGPGDLPGTSARGIGYPVSDETNSSQGPRYSVFETGAIYWTPGTRGCILSGSLWEIYKQNDLGMPLTGNTPVAGGMAAYFERGILFSAYGAAPGVNTVLVGTMDPPLLGRPMLVNPNVAEELQFATIVRWQNLESAQYKALVAWRPNVFAELWTDRLVLAVVGSASSLVPLQVVRVVIGDHTNFYLDLNAVLEPVSALADRTLYDLQLILPVGINYALSPHSVYVKRDWDYFGLLHITDLHVNDRNDRLRVKLQALGLGTAAEQYCNFQDCFRDFVRYANKLHSLGLADAVVATGDLIDYIFEDGDTGSENNFTRLRRLILGEPFTSGVAAGEELKIPIFTTFGNHDYRLYPYDFILNIDLPGHQAALDEFYSHNIIESDAIALMGGTIPTYGVTDGDKVLRMLKYDINEATNAYGYFEKYFSSIRSYMVKLGKHRMVVLDTKYDNGIPDQADLAFLFNALIHGLPDDQKSLFEGGAPQQLGFAATELSLLHDAIQEAGADGLVIVGMHAPAMSPVGGEYPYYFRETLRATADPTLTQEYIASRQLSGGSWTIPGTPYFKVGDVTDGLDSGILKAGHAEFMQLCCGVNEPRPVDLILHGHVHDRVEYRVRWNANASRFEYYNDFYTENPAAYYQTKLGHDIVGMRPIPKGAPLVIKIDTKANANAVPMATTLHAQGAPGLTYGQLTLPPYATPLNDANDAKRWWIDHRPLFAQTAALGPEDPRQRFGNFYTISPPKYSYRPTFETDKQPQASDGGSAHPVIERAAPALPNQLFQGFRLIQVDAGAISKIRYVTLRDLRAANFVEPWEPRRSLPTGELNHVLITPNFG